MRPLSFRLLGLLAAASVLLVACGDDDDGSSETREPTAVPTASSPTAEPGSPTATADGSSLFDFSQAVTTASGLSYIDVEEGSGAQPRPDQLVAVHYTGLLASTGDVFDSTAGEEPATFALTRVIRGFAEGIGTMREGGKRTLYIPADLAYGDSPPPGSGIPAGADLIFEVELISVK